MSRYANLWEETAVAPPVTPPLGESTRARVAILGAGYLGLSAALHLAQAGADAVVLDAEGPGFGASGRNGGQVIPGLKYDPEEIEAVMGRERGERLWRFAGSTADFVFDLVDCLGLAAEARRTAWIQGVHAEAAAIRARSRARQWQARGADVAYVDAGEAARLVGTSIYVGAFVDRRAGAIQPLSYSRELARVALAAGARIHGKSPVAAIGRSGSGWRVTTASGTSIDAEHVLVCTNAYSGPLFPDLPASIVAANSLQIATVPLPVELRAAILPGGEVLSDTRRIIRYWRTDNQGRFIMGGRGPYRDPEPESDWGHLKHDVASLYPTLAGIPFTHRWAGRVAIHPDYWPRLHVPEPGIIAAIGCQGRGIGWQSAMGAELARIVLDKDHEPVLPVTGVARIPFAPLKRVGVSLTIAAMRVLDRLGIA